MVAAAFRKLCEVIHASSLNHSSARAVTLVSGEFSAAEFVRPRFTTGLLKLVLHLPSTCPTRPTRRVTPSHLITMLTIRQGTRPCPVNVFRAGHGLVQTVLARWWRRTSSVASTSGLQPLGRGQSLAVGRGPEESCDGDVSRTIGFESECRRLPEEVVPGDI